MAIGLKDHTEELNDIVRMTASTLNATDLHSLGAFGKHVSWQLLPPGFPASNKVYAQIEFEVETGKAYGVGFVVVKGRWRLDNWPQKTQSECGPWLTVIGPSNTPLTIGGHTWKPGELGFLDD